MKGEWLLIRLKPRGKEKAENWLLRKIDDAEAGATDALVETGADQRQDRPDDAGDRRGHEPQGSPKAEAGSPTARRQAPRGKARRRRSTRPSSHARSTRSRPATSGSTRSSTTAIARCSRSARARPKIYTRTGLDWTDKFPGVAASREIDPRRRADRRRDRRVQGRQARLLDAPGSDRQRQAGPDAVRLRPALAGRRGLDQASPDRAQGAAPRAGRGRARADPVLRAHPRRRREAVRGDVPRRL